MEPCNGVVKIVRNVSQSEVRLDAIPETSHLHISATHEIVPQNDHKKGSTIYKKESGFSSSEILSLNRNDRVTDGFKF